MTADPYYCTLYVDTVEPIDDLQAALDEACDRIFKGIGVEAPAYRNDGFDADARSRVPYQFIQCSRYFVELGTLEEVPEQLADFQSGVAEVVRSLREEGRFVTAACCFEDLIADNTGWNWTGDTPEPPGRTVRGWRRWVRFLAG
ncbi:MAG TPA: hypothetical protein VGB92_05505 [Longimicrobium sp.]|jgi:hypothetical protein